jgi:hypothetical protein
MLDSISSGVLKVRDLRISLERALEQELISNVSSAHYAITKLNTLGAILSAVAKTKPRDSIIQYSFSEEDLKLISSIVNFACTVMLYEPEDIKLSNFLTRVLAKVA